MNQGTRIFPTTQNPDPDNTRLYMKVWSSGNYTLCLREGGSCVSQYTSTVNVYAAVGTPSITRTSTGNPECETTSTYSAYAANATNYQWIISPSTAGTVRYTGGGSETRYVAVDWSSTYNQSATLRVYATNPGSYGNGPTTATSVSRIAPNGFLTDLNPPSSAPCEGESAAYVAWANFQSDFEWYIGRDNTVVVYTSQGTTSTLHSSSVSHDDAVVRVKISPLTICYSSRIESTLVRDPGFTVIERVHSLSLTIPDEDPYPENKRCQGAEAVEFKATATSVGSFSWNLSPSSAGTISNISEGGGVSRKLLTWSPDFHSQDATIEVTAYGCGGSEVFTSRTIEVVKLATVYDIIGPTELCKYHQSEIQLSGSDQGASYELFFRSSPNLSWISDGSGTSTTWQIPIAHQHARHSTGEYQVQIRADPVCPVQLTPIHEVSRIMPSEITITSNPPGLQACFGESYLELSASGGLEGTGYSWRRNMEGTPDCNQNVNCQPILEGCNNSCLLPSINYPPIYVAGIDLICNEVVESDEIEITVVPRLQIKFDSIEPTADFICQGAGPTTFKVELTGTQSDYQWNVTPGAVSSMVENSYDELLVNWNPEFTGDVEVIYTGAGCQGNANLVKTMHFYPALESDENSVRTYQAQQPFTRSSDLIDNMLQADKVATSTSYFDGLGRNVQNVSTKASPQQKDLIELKRYDDFGRESIRYLPYADNQSLSYRSNAIDYQSSFYANAEPTFAQDADPYSVTQFEASPLNRPLKQGAPGTAWQPGNDDPYDLTDHTLKMAYEINGPAEVIWFSYDPASGSISADGNGQIRYYPVGELFANKTFDEANNATVEFTDKEGRTLCKKVQYAGDLINPLYASTYYIYDNFGNLVTVLPPEAVNSAINQLTEN